MKSNTQLRQDSIKRVLTEIKQKGPISKRELQAVTGFSWGNISSVITLLMNEKYITPLGKQETFVGRKPEEFDISMSDNYIIGIDFNSEGILAVVCDLKGRVISNYKAQFEEKNKEHALKLLYTLTEKVISDNKSKKINYIALAMQGEVDTENGISVGISAIKGWKYIPICAELKNLFGIEIVMLHDPDCLLYTERCFGFLSGKETENAILLRIDHGIGIAALLGGKMYMGSRSRTCEIGTSVVPVNGGWTLLKNLVNEKAIEAEYLRLSNNRITCDEIAALAENGQETAKEIFINIGNVLGFALNNAIGLLNPERVILFGEFTKYSDLFLAETERLLNELLGEEKPQIVLSGLKSDAAAVGASLFAADIVIQNLKFKN